MRILNLISAIEDNETGGSYSHSHKAACNNVSPQGHKPYATQPASVHFVPQLRAGTSKEKEDPHVLTLLFKVPEVVREKITSEKGWFC